MQSRVAQPTQPAQPVWRTPARTAPARRRQAPRVLTGVALQIARDVASTSRGRSNKAIAATLTRYLAAADLTVSQLQFDHLVAVIASGSLR